MAIIYQQEEQLFTIHTKNTTYQMKVDAIGCLLHLYYGARAEGNMDYLIRLYDRGFSGNLPEAGTDRTYSMDALLQEYPTLGTGDYRSCALNIRHADGAESCDLRYVSHEIRSGKYSLQGLPAVYAQEDEAETLSIVLSDAVTGIQVELLYGVLDELDIITRSAVIRNKGTQTVTVEKAGSAVLDFYPGCYDLISFYGRHAMERNFQRSEVVHGVTSIGTRRGTSSHQYNPAVVLAERDTTESAGNCYGMVFVYSGSFQFEAEKDQYNQVRAVMGLQQERFSYPLASEEELIVPETILTFSGKGFGKLSSNYHRCIREHVCRGKYKNQVRPVLINSWEASYFDFNGDTIVDLAKDAAALGIELVVMDDGWFGYRNDDNTSLGDWRVNEGKLGCTLGELAQRVNEQGVKFGIWFEPEMISEDSDLYRAHPDWAFQIPGRKPVRSRNQLVLDFSREEVRNYIFEQVCHVLDHANVEYVKWDMNRSIEDVYSAQNAAGSVLYKYVLGVYEFLEKLLQRYPNLLIEGCSGGGGRYDAGMMYYTPQIWCSDNSDAIDRTRIQYGSSFFYPISTVGSHVSAVPNHQNGRITSLKTRGVVAMAGTFGYELNPRKMTQEEQEEVKEQIQTYKKYAELIQNGNYYRLSNPFEDEAAAWQFVSEDQSRTLLNVVMLEVHGNMTVNYVKLRGLKADGIYTDTETGRSYSGAALMHAGLPVTEQMGEYRAYQTELVLQ